MKALTLLLLRLSTGIYLILWGLIKLQAKDMAVGVSDKYYGGVLSSDLLNYGVGVVEVVVGLLVVLGLMRSIAYAGQVVFYFIGAAAIIANLIDPFGLFLAAGPKLTFFPSWTLLFASLIIIAFKEYDTYSIDAKRQAQ